jgi:hypothetical protein
MRPYIICHMLSSVDGKIDGAALGSVTADGEYEATGAKLNGEAWICGRTTMQQHFAEHEPFALIRAAFERGVTSFGPFTNGELVGEALPPFVIKW